MSSIAIIGAGVSGLAAAFRLKEAGLDVHVFEKSRGFSGRAASRSRQGCRFDYGANYFKPDNKEVAHLIFETLPTNDLSPIKGPIATFDKWGNTSPGDPQLNAQTKWNYRSGISTLGKLLVETGKIDVARETRIASLQHTSGRWLLHDAHEQKHGPYDAVLFSTPGPQTVDLLCGVEAMRPVPELIRELRRAEYHTQFAVALHFSETLAMPGDNYALINSDRSHDLAWLSHENRKSDRIPDGETLLIAQLSPTWSETHFDAESGSVTETAWQLVADLLPEPLPRPDWANTQRWRFAHPHSSADPTKLRAGEKIGFYFCGDALVGKGRVTRAIETGFQAASALKAKFSSSE